MEPGLVLDLGQDYGLEDREIKELLVALDDSNCSCFSNKKTKICHTSLYSDHDESRDERDSDSRHDSQGHGSDDLIFVAEGLLYSVD